MGNPNHLKEEVKEQYIKRVDHQTVFRFFPSPEPFRMHPPMRAFILASLIGLLGINSQAFAQLGPEATLKSFTVAPGLEATVWASEPLFVNPTTLTIDHKGRVWVCEAVNYRNRLRGKPPTRKEGDRVLVLEDTDSDGKADKVTTFYQSSEVESPLGIAILPTANGQKVFVCQSPQIWVFDDADGDLKADGPPKTLLKGFQGIDHDHGVHGIQIGPDGRLWFTVGDAGVNKLVSSDGKGKAWTSNSTDCRAGTVWSCKTDGTDLVRYAHNFRNNYMASMDSFRSVFLSDNDDDGNQQTRICFVMPDGNYGYHPRGAGQTHWHEEQPGIVPKILRTGFGSPTGMSVYEGKLLPEKYQGMLLHTDAGPRHVRSYMLKGKGAGYEVEAENLITSSDPWFRPSDVQVGPDGSLFVADWYDPGVGGHGMGDITRGRIYRLAPKGNKPSRIEYTLASDEGIINALGSPNLAARAGAIAMIQERGKNAAPLLFEVAQAKSGPFLFARALGLLADMKENFDEADRKKVDSLLDNALNGSDERMAQLAVRVDPRIPGWLDGPTEKWKAFVEKAPTSVLRELLLVWRNADPEKLRPAFDEIVKRYQAGDVFLSKALNISAGADRARRDVVMADLETVLGGWSDRVAQLVFDLRPASFGSGIAKRISDTSIPEAQRADLIDILAAEDNLSSGKVLLEVLSGYQPVSVRNRAQEKLLLFLGGKWAALAKDQDFAKKVNDLKDRALWAKIAGAAKMEAALPGLIELSRTGDTKGAREAQLTLSANGLVSAMQIQEYVNNSRTAALNALGRFDRPEAVAALAQGVENPETRVAALAGLGTILQTRDAKQATSALEVLKNALQKADPKKGSAAASELVQVLVSTQKGSDWLLSLPKADLAPALASEVGRLLRNSPYQIIRNKAMIAYPAPGKLNMANLPKAADLALRKGDALKGKALFEASAKNELQCLKCHRAMGKGGDIGPDLSLIGKKASKENLLDSLLTPSKAIADQYIVSVIETKNGQVISGLVLSETPEAITLRDGNGKDHRIASNDIEARSKSKVSIMPQDLVAWMSEDDLVDLAEYLLTFKTGSTTPASWQILGPFPDKDGSALATDTPIEKVAGAYSNLKDKSGKATSWKPIRPAADGYLDLAAFHGTQKDNSYSFLTSGVKSPVDQEATLLLGADDGSRIWINGALVHEQNGKSAASPAMFRIPVKLKAGDNSIFVKITNGDGPHGLYLSILSEQELVPAK